MMAKKKRKKMFSYLYLPAYRDIVFFVFLFDREFVEKVIEGFVLEGEDCEGRKKKGFIRLRQEIGIYEKAMCLIFLLVVYLLIFYSSAWLTFYEGWEFRVSADFIGYV